MTAGPMSAPVSNTLAGYAEGVNQKDFPMTYTKWTAGPLTREQAAIIGVYTGYLAGPFSDLHEYIEKVMGRPVFTHEMASKDLAEQIREASKADFLSIVCPTREEGQDNG